MTRIPPFLLALGLVAGGCQRLRGLPEEEAFALSLVEAARSPAGIGPELVDEAMVERLRRIQLVKRTTLDTHDPAKLLEALAGESGPDRQYPVAERPARQRERATRGLRAALSGRCRAARWDLARDGRVRYLTTSLANVPAPILDEQARLAKELAGARAVRVTCERGDVVLLLVPRPGGGLRAADLFPAEHGNVEVNPNDPTMK